MPPDITQRAVSTEICRRSFDLDDIELRDDTANGGGFTFEGTASVVDFPYTVRDRWGEYTETIKAGAFNKTLRDGAAAVSLYVNHRHSDVPLATRGAGTLEVSVNPHLRVKASLDPVRPDVQIIASAIRRGEMSQMSIGFNPVKTRDIWNSDMSEVVRGEVALREASIVEVGANTGGTAASMRSFNDFLDTLTDTDMSDEELLRGIEYFQSRLAPESIGLPARDAVAAAASFVDAVAAQRLIDTIREIPDPLERAAAGTRVFGKRWVEVIFDADEVGGVEARLAEIAEAEALALQFEQDWAMGLRRKHALA